MVFCEYLFFPSFEYKILCQNWNSKKSKSKTIRRTIEYSYKKTVAFDPSKSDTYRALHEDHFGNNVHEIPITVQHQTYQPTRGAPVSLHFFFVLPLWRDNNFIYLFFDVFIAKTTISTTTTTKRKSMMSLCNAFHKYLHLIPSKWKYILWDK